MSSPSTPRRSRAAWTWALGLAVTAGFLALALRGERLTDIAAALRGADPSLLIAAAAVATATFPLRTVRWHVILRAPDGAPYAWRPLWHATAIGFMANNLLPARAGEFARAFALSRQTPARFTTALASIAVERIFDALVMLGLMAIAIAAPSFPRQAALGTTTVSHAAMVLALVFGAALVLGLVVVLHPAPWLAGFERVVRAIFPERLAARVCAMAEGLVAGLDVLKHPGRFATVVLWSLVLWLVNAASFALCFRAFHLPVPAEGALLLQGILGFGVALPAAPGFFGVFELATKLTLEFYGIASAAALAYAIAYHLAGFVPITVLGLQSLSTAHLRLRDVRGEPGPA